MFSATDIVNFLACRHLGVLEHETAAGKREKPFFRDPSQELLRELGIRHERNYLRELVTGKNLNVAQIPAALSWAEAVAETTGALHSGADVVYQGTLADGPWGGRSDFLVKVEKPSVLGSWSYEVVETKLARSARANAVLQLCFYSDILDKIQGGVPERMHVALGDSKLESFQVARYIVYFRKIRNDFLRARPAPADTYPEPAELCRVCTWFPVCDKQRHADDHLSVVAGITRNQRKQLVANGVKTLEALGTLKLPMEPKIERIGDAALIRIRGQALLQRNGRTEGKMIYEILEPIEEEKGFAALPAPSPGDVFLDFEGDEYAFGTGVEYLFGTLSLTDGPGKDPVYAARWSLEPSAEKQAFEEFIGKMLDTWSKFPDFHIYHYAPYEQTAKNLVVGLDTITCRRQEPSTPHLIKLTAKNQQRNESNYHAKTCESYRGTFKRRHTSFYRLLCRFQLSFGDWLWFRRLTRNRYGGRGLRSRNYTVTGGWTLC
ncbi:MAG: TM0106 family RecB-like putative nuclease [Candidatus Acidiferrales bacterium]